ncbi:MAG: hypothetical protein KKB31_06245 [Nanoarchaeota archaeon]|nr:hypothetical protein [Nanoarchaeota archaeon]
MLKQFRGLKEHGYFGIYRGEVVDNKDPSRSGRCKIKVYGIYDGVAKQDLPWADPCFPIGGSKGYGSVYIPVIGSKVFVVFEAGEIFSPVYLGASPLEGDIPAEIDVPNKYLIIKTKSGAQILVSDAENEGIKLETSGGLLFELDDICGRIRLRDKAGSFIELAGGDIIIQAKRKLHLNPGS